MMRNLVFVAAFVTRALFGFELHELEKTVKFPPAEQSYYDSATFLNPDEFEASLQERKNLQKIASLKMALAGQSTQTLGERELSKLVSFIEWFREKHPVTSGHSVYVHKDAQLPLSVQFYDNAHTYINLEDDDVRQAKGGFKKFSRALDYDTGVFYAHLRADVGSEHRLQGFVQELRFMDLMQRSGKTLHYRDTDMASFKAFYPNGKAAGLLNVLSIHSTLYEGDLKTFRGVWTSCEQLLDLLKGMAEGIEAMHERDIIHRDIKPGNFFFKGGASHPEVVVADFGLSQRYTDRDFGRGLCGTRGFMAPESCRDYARDSRKIAFHTLEEGKASDIFSLGMSMRELIWGEDKIFKKAILKLNHLALPPSSERTDKLDLKGIHAAFEEFKAQHQTHFPSAPDQAKRAKLLYILDALLWQMLKPDALRRPSASDVVRTLEQIEKVEVCH